MNTTCDIAVIGGGAAGLTAAIASAAHAKVLGASLRVVVLEADDRTGRSILKTGNGRCNLSNAHIAEGPGVALYRNASFVRDALDALSRSDAPFASGQDPVLGFFDTVGLVRRQEADGRLYPLANKASVVLDVLRAEAARLGVEEACNKSVEAVERPRSEGSHFTIRLATGEFWRAGAVVLACGGQMAGHMRFDGLVPQETQPVLGPLAVSDADRSFTRELDNIRARCLVSLCRPQEASPKREVVYREHGELLFRPYGVSGICVFNASRLARPGDVLRINFLGSETPRDGRVFVQRRLEQLAQRGSPVSFDAFLRGLVLPRVAEALCKRAGVFPDAAVEGDAGVDMLFRLLCECDLEIAGIGPAAQCQVWRGGYAPDGFDAATMGAIALPGLFAAGDALDIDGPCGGYNLHWAWASGLLAGRGAASHFASSRPTSYSGAGQK